MVRGLALYCYLPARCEKPKVTGNDQSEGTLDYQWFFIPLGHPVGLPNGLSIARSVSWETREPPRLVSICIRQIEVSRKVGAYPLFELMELANETMKRGGASFSEQDQVSSQAETAAALTIAEVGVPRGYLPEQQSLDRALEFVRQLQRAYGVLLQRPVKLVTREQLPIFVPAIQGVCREKGPPVFHAINLMMTSPSGVRRSTRAPDLDENLLDAFGFAFDVIRPGVHPFATYADLRNESWVQHWWEGNALQAGIATGISAEVFLDTLLLLLMWEEKMKPEEAAPTFDKQFKVRVQSEYHPRLGGSWSVAASSPIAAFIRTALPLRNRIAHAGYLPTNAEVENAQQIVSSVEVYVRDLLVRNLKRWPATTSAWIGIENLESAGASKKQLQWLKDQLVGVDTWVIFDRWRQQFVRARGGLPDPGETVESLALLWIRPMTGLAFWVVWDRAARMAGRVSPPKELSQGALAQLDHLELRFTEDPPDVAVRTLVNMPSEVLKSLTPHWEPDYLVIPDEDLFLPD